MPRRRKTSQPELLREYLENYTVPTLKSLARLLDSSLPTRKAELIAVIRKRLEDPESLRQLWRELNFVSPVAQSILLW